MGNSVFNFRSCMSCSVGWRKTEWIPALCFGACAVSGDCLDAVIPVPQESAASVPNTANASSKPLPLKIASKYLPNAVRVHAKVISGGLPEGEKGFTELKTLGVQTVISVDGATPDIATAEKFGIRYVHLPHGYDGIPEAVGNQLGKAVRDLPGPIYIHCHHGKHRSPAAAAVACIEAGFISKDSGNSLLEIAGTSPHYRGLYESVKNAERLDARKLDDVVADFPKVARIPALAETMTHIEHAHDHLKLFEQARWSKVANHPDLDAAHEALLLREQFTELLRSDEIKQRDIRFQQLVRESEIGAAKLEAAIRQQQSSPGSIAGAELVALLAHVSDRCTQCHREFRDIPLSEKKSTNAAR